MNTYFMEELIMNYKFMNEEMLNNMQAIEETNQKSLMESFKIIDIMFSMTKEYFGENVVKEVYKMNVYKFSEVGAIVVKWNDMESMITFEASTEDVKIRITERDKEYNPDDIDPTMGAFYRGLVTIYFKTDTSESKIDFHGYTGSRHGKYRIHWCPTLEEKQEICEYYLALSNAIEHAFKLGLLGEKFDKENFDK